MVKTTTGGRVAEEIMGTVDLGIEEVVARTGVVEIEVELIEVELDVEVVDTVVDEVVETVLEVE